MKLTVDFAFEGFKTIQKAGFNIVAWGGLLGLALLIGLGSFVPLALPAILQLSKGGQITDPMAVMGLFSALILPYFLLLIVLLVAYSVVACAVYRVVLGEPKTSFAYLKLGEQEWRNIGVNFLFALIFMAIYLGVLVAGSLAGGLIAVLLSLINKDLAPLGVFVGIAVALVAMVWILIRLSLFSVQTYADKKLNLFGSWKLTKGHVWTLLGGYIITWIVAMVVESIGMLVIWLIVGAMALTNLHGLEALGNTTTPDIGRILTTVAPMVIVYLLLSCLVIFPMMVSIMYSASAAAYRTLAGTGTTQVENVF